MLYSIHLDCAQQAPPFLLEGERPKTPTKAQCTRTWYEHLESPSCWCLKPQDQELWPGGQRTPAVVWACTNSRPHDMPHALEQNAFVLWELPFFLWETQFFFFFFLFSIKAMMFFVDIIYNVKWRILVFLLYFFLIQKILVY